MNNLGNVLKTIPWIQKRSDNMKICMDCGEVELFDVDANKTFKEYGKVYCKKCIKKKLEMIT
jgi:ribosomal protein L34E